MTQPKSILITGTSSGFGLHASIFLAQKGYRVYATMRNLDKSSLLKSQAEKAGVEIHILPLDVTEEDTINDAITKIAKECNGPDILINNAGFSSLGFFTDSDNTDYYNQFATNFFGALNCARAVIPGMIERKSGTIINVTSILGLMAYPVLSAYCSSKFALEGWTESLRYELKPYGVYAVLLEPGYFETDIGSPANIKSVVNKNNIKHPYAYMCENQEKGKSKGSDPILVGRKLHHIIACKKPKLRYTVGTDAFLGSLLKRWLPGSLFEKILQGYLYSYS